MPQNLKKRKWAEKAPFKISLDYPREKQLTPLRLLFNNPQISFGFVPVSVTSKLSELFDPGLCYQDPSLDLNFWRLFVSTQLGFQAFSSWLSLIAPLLPPTYLVMSAFRPSRPAHFYN